MSEAGNLEGSPTVKLCYYCPPGVAIGQNYIRIEAVDQGDNYVGELLITPAVQDTDRCRQFNSATHQRGMGREYWCVVTINQEGTSIDYPKG